MHPTTAIAFKEWAVICKAVEHGRQTLILRKGGIHEGRDGFRVQHAEFWLFPTNFHQAPEDLSPRALDLWESVRSDSPAEDVIPIQLYVVVENVYEIVDSDLLPKLAGLHGWSDRVLTNRFQYKTPGLFALVVRAYQRPEPFRLESTPSYAGCRSWVELTEELPTAGLRPVLTDHEFALRKQQIASLLA